MIPADQEFWTDTPAGVAVTSAPPARLGDCLRACVATLLDLPREDVPHFIEQPGDWAENVTFWLSPRGVASEYVEEAEFPALLEELPAYRHVIGIGPSPRGVTHAVVLDAYTGELIHDPHPSRAGLTAAPSALFVIGFTGDDGPAWTETRGRQQVRGRADGRCEICGSPGGIEWSHRIPRSRLGSWSPANGTGLCRRCHAALHANPARAYAGGWHLESGSDPATSPVWLAAPWPGWFYIDDAPSDGGPHVLVPASDLNLDAPVLPFSAVSLPSRIQSAYTLFQR